MQMSRFIIIFVFILAASSYCIADEEADDEKEDILELLIEPDATAEEIDSTEILNPEDYIKLGPIRFIDADTNYKENYTGDSYDYREPEERKIEPRKERTRESSGPKISTSIFGPFLKLLLAIVILFVLFFLVQAIRDLNLNKRKKLKPKKVDTPTSSQIDANSPEELNETDLRILLKKAAAEKDYYAAVRYYFLIYLEKLEKQKEISYHQDKTNADYLSEITNQKSSAIFSQLSYLYEYVWYGKKEVNLEMYEQMALTFEKAIE